MNGPCRQDRLIETFRSNSPDSRHHVAPTGGNVYTLQKSLDLKEHRVQIRIRQHCFLPTPLHFKMFFVIFESSEHSETSAMSAKFYDKLHDRLQGFPGFIGETTSTSIGENQFPDIFIATFEDDAAADRWRRDPTHLRIQHASREKIFIDYRLRAGPQIQPNSLLPSELSPSVPMDRLVMIIEAKRDEATTPHGFHTSQGMEGSISHVSSYKSTDKLTHLITWKSTKAAVEYARSVQGNPGSLVYLVKIVRDYTMTSRDEAP